MEIILCNQRKVTKAYVFIWMNQNGKSVWKIHFQLNISSEVAYTAESNLCA